MSIRIDKQDTKSENHTMDVYCGNCENGPVNIPSKEDMEKTRCTSCGVYMHDAILAEDYDEDYCLGCESGVDASDAHSKKCQQQEIERSRIQYENYYGPEKNDDEDEDEDYCHGCESGVDCASAHTEKCQQMMKQN